MVNWIQPYLAFVSHVDEKTSLCYMQQYESIHTIINNTEDGVSVDCYNTAFMDMRLHIWRIPPCVPPYREQAMILICLFARVATMFAKCICTQINLPPPVSLMPIVNVCNYIYNVCEL